MRLCRPHGNDSVSIRKKVNSEALSPGPNYFSAGPLMHFAEADLMIWIPFDQLTLTDQEFKFPSFTTPQVCVTIFRHLA